MITTWRDRAKASVRGLAKGTHLSRASSVKRIRQLYSRLLRPPTAFPSEIDILLQPALSQLRWAMVGAVLVLALAPPLTGRLGEPTWTLVLAFALYNGAVVALRRRVLWLQSRGHVALLDLLVVGTLFTLAATPGGPIYILFLLITVCAAATSPLWQSLIYTGVVAVLLVLVSPTLPLWPEGITGIRDLFARLLILGLASTMTTLLVRRLEQEHLAARFNRDKAAREAELNRLRSVWVSSVSHDLRTPLTALRAGLGMVEMSLQDRLRPDEAGLLATARRNSERLVVLIDDLLTYHQLEAGTLDLSRTRLDLADVVGAAVGVLQPLLNEKQQHVRVDLDTPLPVEGDRRRLEQALVNVLANAHQHTPAHTQIHITAEATPSELLLTVHDNGPGIPAAELERVFQRFHRLAPGGSGSGLGLAIAQSMVERHGGRMWAESAYGTGTSVHLALPRCEPQGT